jgi:hypothetical protein
LGSAAEKLRSLLDSADERIALGAARAMLELVPKLRADGEFADALRDLAVRDAIEEMLRGNPDVRKFEEFSVRPEALPTLGPDEITLMRLYRALERRAQQAAKQKKP